MSKSVLMPVSQGFEEVEAIAVVDVLRRAGLDVTLAAVGDGAIITGTNGVTITADATLKAVENKAFDFIALPGGHANAMTLGSDERVQSMLKAHAQAGRPMGAICAAPTALHKAGLIKGTYTCYPGYEASIGKADHVADQKVVVNGNVITSRGPGTALCFGVAIVRLLLGEESAQQVQTGMLIGACE